MTPNPVRRSVLIWLLGTLFFRMAFAQAQQPAITNYVHTSWGEKEGAPKTIWAFAQTSDGFLWIGSNGGLSRFDGSTFEQYQPISGPALPSGTVTALLAIPNGDLWIGFRKSRVSLLRDGRAVNYVVAQGTATGDVHTLVQDHTGILWAATSTGLMRFEGNRWSKAGTDWGFPPGNVDTIFVDRRGTMWAVAGNTILFLPSGAKTFRPTSIQVGHVAQIAEAPNGRLWLAETSRSVRPLPSDTTSLPSNETEIRVGSNGIFFAQDGALWITTLGDGLMRVPVPEELHGRPDKSSTSIERDAAKDGLSDTVTMCVFQDREGDIWVGTLSGVDRFRKSSFTTLVQPAKTHNAMLVSDGADTWIESPSAGYWRAHGHTVTHITDPLGSYAQKLYSAYREPAGTIWWITSHMLLRSEKNRFEKYPMPKLLADAFDNNLDRPAVLSEDRSGVLWVDIGEKGLFYRKGNTWNTFDTPASLARLNPASTYLDDDGRIWIAYLDGTIACLKDGNIRTIVEGKDSPVGGDVYSIRGSHGHIWIAGLTGLGYFDGNHLHAVIPSDIARFKRVNGMEETVDGSLWLREQRGVVHINADELQKFIQSPNYRVHYELFDSLDGLPGRFESNITHGETLDNDGRLWFAATDGFAWLDSASMPKSSQPPPAVILKVIADGTQMPSQNRPVLPPLTGRLEIDYAGLNLAAPERVRYRYELEGIDRGWQDGGAGHLASYTNLPPGKHRFRLNARNVGGEWNKEDTVMEFIIAPAWFQTYWFLALCAAAGLFIVWVLYRIRVQQIANAIALRFDERLAERTRIARDFHDTLMQTIQGTKLVADSALKRSSDNPNAMRGSMEQVSVWMGRATEEGRAALNSLRTSTTDTNDLAEALRRAIDECKTDSSPETSFTTTGVVKEMHPIVRDEVYRIGYEAIHNTCVHSQATHLQVELTYADDLVLRVQDNGVGIEPAIASEGRHGHYGLQGMRERAARIMGRLTVETSKATGTEIKLVVPGRIIYRKTSPGQQKPSLLRSFRKRMGLSSDSKDS